MNGFDIAGMALRIGASLVDVIARAIAQGDVSTLDKLHDVCPGPEILQARALAEEAAARLQAERELGK